MGVPEVRRYLGGLRHTARFQGLRGLLWKVVSQSLSPFGHVGLENLCQKDLSRPLKAVQARAAITICTATEADVEQVVDLAAGLWGDLKDPGPYTDLGIRGTIRSRLGRGQKCFLAKIGPRIVHYNWIAFDWEETVAGTGRFIRLADDEAVCHDGLTVEAWRGRGIHMAVHNEMLLYLQRKGYRRAYTVVGAAYRSSNITHHRLDWEFTGTLFYFISRRTRRGRVWRVSGSLEPFVHDRPVGSSRGA